ncbi:sigma-54-dependent Fis family transcriptional regulator [Roseateles oligotrophus]|uniref:GAF domain-containing protein n=1 Tax=Roseateles oligotrophus TaxID=1769250 RepID=A0ABT2YFJ8_9BURK|nr:GAF domain-containing protein [Roseateles oligotrophus]MCV2368799.1 GAF domain-containing protein [Roseateles oligotrophus]
MLSSHERCQVFGLSPQQRADMSCLSQASLVEVLQRNARLCAQALPIMEMLYEQLIHAHSMVLLTDASGVVMHALGDPAFLERAQRVALTPGAVWSEAVKGTNAVGTALMTEAPTLVNGQDHYLREFHFLTCSAAPIFDHKGALLGVINVSGDRRTYHPHTLALALMAARMVETQWFNDLFRQSLRLHIHPSSANLGTLREGVLALDETGRVVGVNRSAIEILGQTATQLRRSALPALFGIDLAGMLEHTHGHPNQPLQLALPKASQSAGAKGIGELLVAAHVEAGGKAPAQCLHGVLSLGQASNPSVAPSFNRLAQAAPERLAAIGPNVQAVAAASAALEHAAALTTSTDALVNASQRSQLLSAPQPLAKTDSNALLEAATLRQTELQAIQAAVLNCRGNLALAARQLGIGRSTLYRKLKDVPAPAVN